MKIQKILISQTEPTSFEKSPINDIAAKHRFEVVYRPFTKVEKVTLKEFRSSRVDFDDCNAVIFTSRHAIDHYFKLATEARYVVPDEKKYFCTTETVALYLQKYITYRKRKIFFGKGTFSDLVKLMTKHKELVYMLPHTDNPKPEFQSLLKANDIRFKDALISKNVVQDISDLNLKEFDLVVIYSSNDMKVLCDYTNSFKDEITLASSGKAAAKVALESNFKVSLWAPNKNFPSMVAAIDQYVIEFNKNHSLDKFQLTSIDEFTTLSKVSGTSK